MERTMYISLRYTKNASWSKRNASLHHDRYSAYGQRSSHRRPLNLLVALLWCTSVICHTYSSDSGILGGWWFGGGSSSPDSNFLRVQNALPIRRLSDNTLMTPKIRVAHSCSSSPGGSPGGLPIRRHSSIGPQERRGSTTNLSPPTVRCPFIFWSLSHVVTL